MTGATGNDLMRLYALRGVREWTRPANSDLRRVAKRLIRDGIVENEAGVTQVFRGNDPRFLPMADLPSLRRSGYEWCFFLPLLERGELVSLVLLLLCRQEDSGTGEGTGRLRACEAAPPRAPLAFRFERERESGSRHQYWHMQLTRRIKVPGGNDIEVRRLPGWLPDSYPAFPVPGESWLDMFLAMLTAVHGYPNGVEAVVRSLWQKASRPEEARVCLKRLRAMGVAAD